MTFARKMPEFYIKIARNFFPNFWGTCSPVSPVSNVYTSLRYLAAVLRWLVVRFLCTSGCGSLALLDQASHGRCSCCSWIRCWSWIIYRKTMTTPITDVSRSVDDRIGRNIISRRSLAAVLQSQRWKWVSGSSVMGQLVTHWPTMMKKNCAIACICFVLSWH